MAAGLAGVARAGGDAIRRTAARPANSVRDAYRQGSQSAWQTTGGTTTSSSNGNNSSTSPEMSASGRPGWARRMERGQRMSHAGQVAVHTLRDGDRGSSGVNPNLHDKDE
jgi:type IV secretion system protein TrbL